jgi:murein DD-endopeptidase MepM/ murein hydrolase activator NlpD
LSEILVNEGDIVKRGDVIAKSGESLTGEMLHLEIWKEREKQNPELWLARR